MEPSSSAPPSCRSCSVCGGMRRTWGADRRLAQGWWRRLRLHRWCAVYSLTQFTRVIYPCCHYACDFNTPCTRQQPRLALSHSLACPHAPAASSSPTPAPCPKCLRSISRAALGETPATSPATAPTSGQFERVTGSFELLRPPSLRRCIHTRHAQQKHTPLLVQKQTHAAAAWCCVLLWLAAAAA